MKDDWRYRHLSPLPEPYIDDDGSDRFPNSPLEQIAHDLSNPQRSPWLTVASLERTCPSELDNLTILTPKQRKYIQLYHFEGLSLQEIGLFYGTTKQAVAQCIGRAKGQILNNLDEVRRILNASICRGVDDPSYSKGHFF